MNERKTLNGFIRKARKSLMLEKTIPILQYGLLLMIIVCALVLIVSRLFVFPYYRDVTYTLAIAVFILTIIFIWIKRVRQNEALIKLDEYYPNNELVTSLSFKDDENPLVKSLLQKAVAVSQASFEKFKQRKKRMWKPPVLISTVLMLILVGILIVFPSETQREAVAIEKEKEIIKDLKKEITKLEKKVENKENKKQLEELKNKLNEVDSAEKALREAVKKQKELKLQEQKLLQKNADNKGKDGNGLTDEQKEQLKELAKIQKDLNENLQGAKSQLSQFGKSISKDLQNELASLSNSNNSINQNNQSNQNNQNNSNNQNNNSNNQNNSSSNNNNFNNNNSNNNNNNNNNNSNNQNNGNNNQNNGNGNGSGNGNGNGNNNGNGNGIGGRGIGIGNGAGTGSGAGLGQGGRELVAIPKRIGEKGDTTVDGGPLGSGESAGQQKGKVNATKGTVRPYQEVIGDYKNSYFESSERLQLPQDLQTIVQSYFSSIEDE